MLNPAWLAALDSIIDDLGNLIPESPKHPQYDDMADVLLGSLCDLLDPATIIMSTARVLSVVVEHGDRSRFTPKQWSILVALAAGLTRLLDSVDSCLKSESTN